MEENCLHGIGKNHFPSHSIQPYHALPNINIKRENALFFQLLKVQATHQELGMSKRIVLVAYLTQYTFGSGYFALRGKIAPWYFAIWRQNSPNGYFATSAKIALSLILTQTLTQTPTLIPTLTLTQTEEKHYFASL